MDLQRVRAGEPDRHAADGQAERHSDGGAIYLTDVALFALGSAVVIVSGLTGGFVLLRSDARFRASAPAASSRWPVRSSVTPSLRRSGGVHSA